ncbi:MAG: fatty acid desaturase [Actinomycetota bacterium]
MTVVEGVDLSPKAERAVARTFMGRIQWEMIVIGVGQSIAWIATFVLTITGAMPLWAGFAIATICCCLAYLPSHEGQHGNLSGRQKRWRWIDPVVGQISLLPLKQSHEVLRVTHLKHHAHTNDPELDVDYHSLGEHWWEPAMSIHRDPGTDVIERHAERDPEFLAGLMRGVPIAKALSLAQLVMVVLFPLETLLVWWLPSKLALSYLYIYFAWEPHRPGTQTGRYRDTRFWRVPAPRFLFQSMQTHVIHHMYPTIPHWDEPKAMEALRPFMAERGVPGVEDIPDRVRLNPLLGRSKGI